jgi:tetratricopeptide (TPR) repeat protein
MNRFKEGIALYKEFLSHNSGHDSDYRYLASLYEKTGDLNEALFHLNMAISIDNGVPFTYFRLSQIYMNIGNFEMALKNINKALSIHNKKSFLHFKAKLLLKLEKIEEAEVVFDELINNWQVDYNKLKRFAFKRGISARDIWSL